MSNFPSPDSFLPPSLSLASARDRAFFALGQPNHALVSIKARPFQGSWLAQYFKGLLLSFSFSKNLFWGAFILTFLSGLALGLLAGAFPALAQEKGTAQNPYKVAMVQAYDLWAYDETMRLFSEALLQLGLSRIITFPRDMVQNWSDLSEEEYLEQVRNLMAREDCDLVITLGTKATRTILRNNNAGKKVLGMAISNPVSAGFVKNQNFSDNPNFTTIVFEEPPGLSMFELFHSMFKFKRLGILYPDNDDARSYTFIAEAREVARNRGFDLIEYDGVDLSESLESCQTGLDYLLTQNIDSFYVPTLACFDLRKNNLKSFYTKLYDNNVLSMSSEDREQTKQYALLGYVFSEFRTNVAKFQAKQALDILQGVSPAEIPMKTHFDSELTLNLAAAEKLGVNLDISFLVNADVLFLDLPGLN
ncbi:MAG: hypothetical protein LBE80_06070 [Deltaproteobacteria bacterium]|jgi:ABC-type uncharacterized transport system substrate-binding protein|nr:hypothetical protein [Deltaproteobacteria bacterium]